MKQLIFLIPFIGGPAIVFGYLHAMKKLRGITITKRSKRIRTAGFVVSEILLSSLIVWYWGFDLWLIASVLFTALMVYMHTIYSTSFDLSINLNSNEKWNYISDNDQDHNDVNSDKIFHVFPKKYSGTIQFIVKIILFIGSATAIILLK